MAAAPLPTTGSTGGRDRLGVNTFQLRFIVDGPREDGGAEPYDQLLSFKPPGPLDLPEVTRTFSKEDTGDWALVITFEGITGNEAVGALLEYDHSSFDAPVETFAKFDLLDARYKADFDPQNKNVFIGWKRNYNPATGVVSPDGGKVMNPMYGISTFLDANAILRVTFLLKEFPSSLLRNLCKIETPQIPRGTERAVETPEGKQWLKKSVKARFRGNCWEIEVEYWLGRWAPEIYNPTA